MKKWYKISALIAVVALSLTLLVALESGGTLTSRALTFSKVKGTALVPAKMMVLTGDSVYLSGIEINGTWTVGKPWPYQAWAWLQDKTSDNPLAGLDWTGINLDSTWTCTELTAGSGIGKYTISKRYTQEYITGKWSNPALTGFLATNNVYSVEVYTVKAGTSTLAKTLNFDLANKDTSFARVLYEASYVAEGRGSFPINAAKRPDSLISATAQSRVYLRNGLTSAWFNVPTGTDSLKYIFKSKTGAFATVMQSVQILTSGEVGTIPDTKVLTPLPSQGFYNPGDTIEISIDLKDNSGKVLDWVNNGVALGATRIEVLLSGPKDDYAQIFTNRYVYSSGPQYDSVSKAKYNSNKVKMVIPATLPNGPGTYTIFVGARRTLGANYQKVQLTDIQIGSTTVQKVHFSSQDVTKSCSKCHGIGGPAVHHAAQGVEECLPCHTKTFRVGFGFDEIAHALHRVIKSEEENLPVTQCTQCHLDGSENKFGKEATTACTACHPVVPFLPQDHITSNPLYAASGKSCAGKTGEIGCHATDNVWKGIIETHAALETKYTGGTVAAKKSSNDLAMDSFDDNVWTKTGSIRTKDGITLNFFYTDNNIFVRAEWVDGHRNYSGDAAGSLSQTRNQWSYDGTTWTISGNEDRLAFIWQMDSPYGGSCAMSCHGYSYFSAAGHSTSQSSLVTTPTGRLDNWQFKAQRTMPVDYADDGYWDNTGRKSDSATGSFGTDNLDATGKLPILMAKDAANNTKPFVMLSETVPFNAASFKAGDKLFGYAVNDGAQPIISGSRADVRAKARFDAATKKWTVIFKRALNTGSAQDAVFDINKTIEFSVAKMDNEGAKHASQGFDIGVYKLSFSKEVVSVEKEIEPINGLNIYPNPVKNNTTISFTVDKPEFVNLTIVDIKGKVVATLVNNVLNPGNYQIPFGSFNLAGGVYYCQIYAGDKRYTKQLVLAK
jgi:hypothetical protein